MPKHAERTEMDRTACILVLAVSALTDALWKASQMSDEGIALQTLRMGAQSATDILSSEIMDADRS